MNSRSSSDTPSVAPELNVSIAGRSPETIAAALDEAVARLSIATGAQPPAAAEHQGDSINASAVLSLIESICKANNRREALGEIVVFIAARASHCTVRGGIGNDQLKQIYDPRLGWLGPESSLFVELRQRWQVHGQTCNEPGNAKLIQQADTAILLMKQTAGAGRCMVWIDGQAGQLESPGALAPAAAAIGSALWSRPGRSWPKLMLQIAHRSSINLSGLGLLILIAALWPVHYRTASRVRVETNAQRLIATPFEATLEQAMFKPGDAVKRGDVLLALDGRPLRLEREAIKAERQQAAKEHDAALATGRIAESQQIALRQRQLARRYELLSDRLQNLEVISPIDGVVVSGDLDRYVGSPLERGQTLMEVAPMDRMVIELEIPEYEIGYVQLGAQTRIKLDAIGGKSIELPIEEIYPRAELRDDRNVFIAKLEVQNPDRTLKPGMLGQATTYGPLRPWIWSWVRGGVEKILWWIGY